MSCVPTARAADGGQRYHSPSGSVRARDHYACRSAYVAAIAACRAICRSARRCQRAVPADGWNRTEHQPQHRRCERDVYPPVRRRLRLRLASPSARTGAVDATYTSAETLVSLTNLFMISSSPADPIFDVRRPWAQSIAPTTWPPPASASSVASVPRSVP